jgi:hypothetical protein
VLAIEDLGIRTGDCGFRAWMRPHAEFISVGKFGGSALLSTRLSGIKGGELYGDV